MRLKKDKKYQIRNSTAEFLIFTSQSGKNSIEVRVEENNVWLTQKLMATLFEVTVPTINEHLTNLYAQSEITQTATIRNFRIVQISRKLFHSFPLVSLQRILKSLLSMKIRMNLSSD
jgi:hypothetical protein